MNKTNKKPELRIHFLSRPSFPTVTNVYVHSRIFLDMDIKKRIQVCVCSKHLLHNKASKRIYSGTVRPLSNSTRIESHAQNVTQKHKLNYQCQYGH